MSVEIGLMKLLLRKQTMWKRGMKVLLLGTLSRTAARKNCYTIAIP